METYVFDKAPEKGSNNILSLSTHYSKTNLHVQCQGIWNGSNNDSGGFQLDILLTIFEEVI